MSREADWNNHESHYLYYEAAVAMIVIEILEGFSMMILFASLDFCGRSCYLKMLHSTN